MSGTVLSGNILQFGTVLSGTVLSGTVLSGHGISDNTKITDQIAVLSSVIPAANSSGKSNATIGDYSPKIKGRD